jgi:hypothetical protein
MVIRDGRGGVEVEKRSAERRGKNGGGGEGRNDRCQCLLPARSLPSKTGNPRLKKRTCQAGLALFKTSAGSKFQSGDFNATK